MAVRHTDMTREECEAWMAKLGADWVAVLKEAGIPESQRYVVPDRWGKNRFQMKKVVSALERIEQRRKSPTDEGKRLAAIAEWEIIGRALSRVPELFERELERLRPIAAGAQKIADGDEARAALLSPTPEPKKPRK